MGIKDQKVLYDIRSKIGGSIHTIANNHSVKYKLSNKKGLINLLNNINGLLRNSNRMLQMNKLCIKYDIEFMNSGELTYNNG
jgi:hypothetical protein